jgi:tripartite-type tricarboxylate transporter receptor subunit TctC
MSRTYKRSPEVRAKISAARKKALADPEVRAKMSAARKKAWADKWPDLARLTADELQIYKTLRRKECGHAEALAEIHRMRRKVA